MMMKEELRGKKRLTAADCTQEEAITPISLQSLTVLNCTAVIWLGGLILCWHCLELQGSYGPVNSKQLIVPEEYYNLFERSICVFL